MASIDIFNAFDAAAIKEAADAAPKDFTESIRRLSALIDMLPQRMLIEDSHAERWVTRTVEMAMIRMELEHGEGKATLKDIHNHVLWHVRRASAIGGSEIGDVVRHFRGETGGFSDARNLVLEKLLIMSPQPGTTEMNRGVRAEPIIQQMYLADMEAVSDEASLDVLKGFRSPKAPQIVGTPDDLVIYADQSRKIIDYKCPSADVNEEYEKKGISFDYVCQVHQYGFFSKESGIDFDGMDIVCFDPRSFTLGSYVVEHDPELLKEMILCSSTLWNDFVMRGELPIVPGPAKLNTEDADILKQMEDLTMQAAVLKVIASEITTRQTETLNRVAALNGENHKMAAGKVDLGFASFSRKRAWDEEQLLGILEAAGLQRNDFLQDGRSLEPKNAEKMFKTIFKAVGDETVDVAPLLETLLDEGGIPYKIQYNIDLILETLESLCVSVTPAARISEGFALSRAKAQAEKVQILKNHAIELADTVEAVVVENALRLLEGRPEDDQNDMEP